MRKESNLPIHIHDHLVAVDAPDGTGKSSLISYLGPLLSKQTSQDVFIVAPNSFQYPASSQAKRKFDTLSVEEQEQPIGDILYRHAFKRNFGTVVLPALQRNAWVILDSSELRPVAYTLATRPETTSTYTKELVSSGRLTSNIFPKYHILLTATPQEMHTRIRLRQRNARSDPHNEEECRQRLDAYKTAFLWEQEMMTKKNLAAGSTTFWKEQAIETIPGEEIPLYLHSIATTLIKWISTSQ